MAIVATVGGSTSNSYVTRQEAVNYFQLGIHPQGEVWAKLSAEDQESLLIQATRIIDMQKIKGVKSDTTTSSGVPAQALRFPRAQDTDASGYFIPVKVKEACYEQALYLTQQDEGTRQTLRAAGVTSVTIGDVSESYSNPAGLSPRGMLAPNARAALGPFLIHGTSISK